MVENDIIDVFCYGSTSVFIRAEKLEFHAIIHNVLKLKTKQNLQTFYKNLNHICTETC